MMGDYWWVFILVIFVIMLVYPTPPKRKDKFKNTKDIKLNMNPTQILTNLNKITSYYVGLT
jgi:hypothetical protein